MTHISFHRFSKLAILLAYILIIVGIIITIVGGGLRFGIEFEAGMTATVSVNNASLSTVQESLRVLEDAQVQLLQNGSQESYLIRVPETGESNFQNEVLNTISSSLTDSFSGFTLLETAYVGPAYSTRFRAQTFLLTFVAVILMLAYLWIRFHFHFAIASVLTLLLHDMLFLFAFIGVSRIEVSVATVAAFLTVLGYSLNDTIVVFDRIRENLTLMKDTALHGVVDKSISQSLSRTIITSITTLLASLSLVVFARGAVRDFAIILSAGIIIGTFSSIFVASPIFVFFRQRGKSLQKNQTEATVELPESDGTKLPSSDLDINALKQKMGWKENTKKKKKKKKP